ncbi:PilZ domain-containing protein [Bradyrhizobium sp. A5]|uniref:PilZ domain-containing protein n=1 Tax=Bradyrhizobium sp. A5 TaxID=3133696 RepID=UPI0035C87073
MSLEWTETERRQVTRKIVNQTALLTLPGDVVVTPCRMLNLSIFGACIRWRDTPLFSTALHLSFNDLLTPFECRVVWRQGALAGLMFVY